VAARHDLRGPFVVQCTGHDLVFGGWDDEIRRGVRSLRTDGAEDLYPFVAPIARRAKAVFLAWPRTRFIVPC